MPRLQPYEKLCRHADANGYWVELDAGGPLQKHGGRALTLLRAKGPEWSQSYSLKGGTLSKGAQHLLEVISR